MPENPDIVFRDYNTPGVPASGDYEPEKARIRKLLKEIAGGTAAIGDYRGPWDSGTDYTQSDIVESGGSLWYSLVENTNVTPVEGLTWTLFMPGATVADEAITAAKLATSDIAAIREKIGVASRFLAFYNASDGDAEYDHGVSVSASRISFGPGNIVNAVADDQSPTLAKDNKIKGAPSPIRVGDEVWVYYDGYGDQSSPMVGNIFVEIYDLNGNPRHRAITPIITPGMVTGAVSLARPSVIYEPEDVTTPFKMVFSRATVAGALNTSLWLATSPNGFDWTILGQAVALGSGWESTSVISTGRMVYEDGLYHLFYGGYDGSFWKGGVATKATFTSGSWTKNPNNPILNPDGAYNLSLLADVAANQSFFRVADKSFLDIGAPILLWTPSSPASCEINYVLNKPNSTDVGVRYPWLGNYTVAAGNKVSQVQSASVDFSEVWFDEADSKWKTIFTAFRFCPDANRETAGYAETADLDTGFTVIPSIWPMTLQPRRDRFDRYSAENIKVIDISKG